MSNFKKEKSMFLAEDILSRAKLASTEIPSMIAELQVQPYEEVVGEVPEELRGLFVVWCQIVDKYNEQLDTMRKMGDPSHYTKEKVDEMVMVAMSLKVQMTLADQCAMLSLRYTFPSLYTKTFGIRDGWKVVARDLPGASGSFPWPKCD